MSPIRVCLFAVAFVMSSHWVGAQTNFITYQGKLTDSTLPANGTYEMQFSLFDASTDGTQIGTTITNSSVQIANGIFSVQLDFSAANAFDGSPRWLEIAVKKPADPVFTTLAPRQQLTSAPFAIRSVSSASADSLAASCSMCVTDGHIESIDGSKVSGAVSNAVNASTANNVTGIVPIANGGTGSSTKNFVDLSTNQTNIGGDKTYTGTVAVTGASGVFSGNGSGLTNLNGSSIAAGTISSVQLASEALPASNSLKLLASRRWDLLKPQLEFATGTNPWEAAFDGTNMWVLNAGSNNITKFRASTGENLGTFPVASLPLGVIFDGSHIWVAGSSNVSKLDAASGATVGSFPVATNGRGVAFDGANVWVANSTSNNVVKLNATNGAVLGTFPTGSQPTGLAFDGANVWITNTLSHNVTKLRASDGANLGTFAVGINPRGIVFDGTNVWIANYGGGVTRLRATDGACVAPCTFSMGGGGPHGIAFDGVNIWVTDSDNPKVAKLRASDGTLLGSFPVGSGPRGVAFDGANVWVANFTSNSVTRLVPAFPEPK